VKVNIVYRVTRFSDDREMGIAGVDLTISRFFGKFDIPHKTNGVWLNGIEYPRVSRFGFKPEHQERIQAWNKEIL
jgi:hypothetical protein